MHLPSAKSAFGILHIRKFPFRATKKEHLCKMPVPFFMEQMYYYHYCEFTEVTLWIQDNQTLQTTPL